MRNVWVSTSLGARSLKLYLDKDNINTFRLESDKDITFEMYQDNNKNKHIWI